ncbi:MAG: hypothetical protein ABGX05_18465 [Pirellulaceae bacterium]
MDSEKIKRMKTVEEVDAAFYFLRSEEGLFEFLSGKARLETEQAERIYRLGYPWPMPHEDKINSWIEEHREVGLDVSSSIMATSQIIDMENSEKAAKLKAFKDTLGRGDEPEPISELSEKPFISHLESVSNLANEDIGVIMRCCIAIHEHRALLAELAQKRSELATQ